jgi:hypothetical protein
MRSALVRSVTLAIVVCSLSVPFAARASAAPAGGHHGGGGSPTTGIDISYPQCSDSLPAGEAFVLVGVNAGLANDYNGCVGSQFKYAESSTGVTTQPRAQLYLNTGDPANGVADWPSPAQPGAYGSTSTPAGTCNYASGTSGPGANSTACAFMYGYDMVLGITYGTGSGVGTIRGDVSAFNVATGSALYDYPVWLDVETGNSWQTGSAGLAMNMADLQGMVAAIGSAANANGVSPRIGVYSTGYQWNQITGTPGGNGGNLAGLPDWIPGASTQSGAASNCSLHSFTAGTVALTQWFGRPFDGDYSCAH